MAADSKLPERFLLPEEVLGEILSKLPLESQLCFRCVCRSWHGIISDPEFALSHYTPSQRIALRTTSIYPILLDGGWPWTRELALYRFVGRSNSHQSRFKLDNRWCRNVPQRELASEATILMTFKGILLVREGKAIYVINPMIRRMKKVFTQDDFNTRVIGICCDSSKVFTDDYKILLAIKCESTGKDVVRVGSFKTKTWKDVPFPYSFDIYNYDVLFVHERIHLFFNPRKFGKYEYPPLLISFDAAKDEFVDVPVPKDLPWSCNCGIGVLDGRIALSMSPPDSQVVDIWILKGYGVNESWTILFTLGLNPIAGSGNMKPLGLTEDGELLIVVGRHPMLYNPNNHSYRNALAEPLRDSSERDIVAIEGNVFFPSQLTEFQLSKRTQGKRKLTCT